MVTLVKAGCHKTYPADKAIGKQRSRKVSWILSKKKKKKDFFSVHILGEVVVETDYLVYCGEKKNKKK